MTDAAPRHRARLVTLAFLCHGDDVLLLRHPDDHRRFPGRWNGVGGHVECGEDVRAAARREILEETGLEVRELELRGVSHESGTGGEARCVFIFVGTARARAWRSPEGLELSWQPRDALVGLPLVSDVAELLPRALDARTPFFATEKWDHAARPALRFDGTDDAVAASAAPVEIGGARAV